MRRYKVVLTSEGSSTPSVTYDSQTNGKDNPGALDIAFDVSVGPLDVSIASSYVEVFGVSLTDIQKVKQWQGGSLSLYGGFSPGFPLAKASQYGLLAGGTILQAFGNWTGTHQSIVFFLTSAGTDKDVVFQWQKGQKLSQAITTALSSSYPGFTVTSMLKNDPAAANTDLHSCPGIYAFATYIKNTTNNLGLAPAQGGIDLFSNGGTPLASASGSRLLLLDSPVSQTPFQLDFNDFQGQPVYFGVGGNAIVQTTLNLRSDLVFGGQFTFPSQVAGGYVSTQPAIATAPLPKDNSALTGTYNIVNLRHVGRFRDPQGAGWVTIIDGSGPV